MEESINNDFENRLFKAWYLDSFSYLNYLYDGMAVPPSDVELINFIRNEYDLRDEVINLIIVYDFANNKGCLNRNYAIKVAASMSKNGYKEFRSSLEYLLQNKKFEIRFKENV